MRFPVTIFAVMAASLALWNGFHGRAPEPSAVAELAAFVPSPGPGPGIQVESGTPIRIRLDDRSTRAILSGGAWEGWTAGPVRMLRAADASAHGRLVLEEVLIPARTRVAGMVTAVRALSPRGALLDVTVRARDARGRSVALSAFGGTAETGTDPEMRFTVHEIVRVE